MAEPLCLYVNLPFSDALRAGEDNCLWLLCDISIWLTNGLPTHTHMHARTHICQDQAVWSLNVRFGLPETENPNCSREIIPSTKMVSFLHQCFYQPKETVFPEVCVCVCWGKVSWYGGRYHRTLVGWMLHNVKVLCYIDLKLSIRPPPPTFLYHDRIITLSTPWFLFPMHPPMSHVYLDWVGGGGGGGRLPLHEPLWRSLGLNHVYPHPSLFFLLHVPPPPPPPLPGR